MDGTNDQVNGPAHYQGDYVIRVIEDFNLDFCLGNVCKYILRAGIKSTETEITDLRKAEWYLKRRIDQLTRNAQDGRQDGPANPA